MDIEKFIKLRPYLYHITDELNLSSILTDRTLKSTVKLAHMINLDDRESFLRTRRIGHAKIGQGKLSFSIRDQDPLYENIIVKNLKDGMNFGDFVYYLNSRIFFWCKIPDLEIHYGRYVNQNEYPIILKAKTQEVFDINKHKPQFCKYNSGAPRSSSYHPERAAPRGKDTFLEAEKYPGIPSSVREVTFMDQCILPENLELSFNISEAFKPVKGNKIP